MMTQDELQAVIQSGEGYSIEFKRSVNADLAKEMVAFANSSGGRIFIGIEDNGNIRGVNVTSALQSEVQTIARNCDPSISVKLEVFDNVLIVHIKDGATKPYRCSGGFFIRNGPNSEKLTTSEIGEFFKEHGRVNFDEMPCSSVVYPIGFDESAIKNFISLLNLTTPIHPDQLLLNLGVIKERNQIVVNSAGVLFFAINPTEYIPQSMVTCVAYKGNSKVEILDKKSFDFHLVANIDESLSFLKRHLNVSFEIRGKQRKERLEIPEVVLREAVVNAVAHRDYLEKGATVMVEIFNNRVEISNPGGLPKGLSEADFGKRTLARNPLIASILNRIKYIEKLGTGVQRMRELMRVADLPEPLFHFNKFFTVILNRYNINKLIGQELAVNEKRGERIYFILRVLLEDKGINLEELAGRLDTTSRTLRSDLDLLTVKGWVIQSGATKGREYKLKPLAVEKLQNYG
jgi:ATP-dependent DNA helicase RecG